MRSRPSSSIAFIGLEVLLLAAAGFLTACSPLATLNAVSTHGSGYSVISDRAYGSFERQRLDVFVPTSQRPVQGWPLVVFFYGGSWTSGDRGKYAFVGAALAERGVVTPVADYRLFPEVHYPDFLKDSALALAYGIEHARELGADSKRVFVMGHSAGGYNAAMLALDPRWLQATHHSPAELAGWIGLSGPYDFLPTDDPELRAIFGHPNYPSGSEPIDHTDSDAPRTFLGAPPDDQVVSFERSTQALARKLDAAGVDVTLRTYPRATHQTLLGSFAWPLRWVGPVLKDVVEFIETTPAHPRIAAPAGLERASLSVFGVDARHRRPVGRWISRHFQAAQEAFSDWRPARTASSSFRSGGFTR